MLHSESFLVMAPKEGRGPSASHLVLTDPSLLFLSPPSGRQGQERGMLGITVYGRVSGFRKSGCI